jgi:hypothetical protein
MQKLIMTINLPGKLGQQTTTQVINFERSSLTDSSVILERGRVNFEKRLETPCIKKVRIDESQYNYFISSETPGNYNGKGWSRLTNTERLNFHLQMIAHPFSYTYEFVE